MSIRILGISAYYHDSSAALVADGEIIAAAQEERFSRKKHDSRFPAHAIRYCLNEAKVGLPCIDYVVFYDKPFRKFERLLETYVAYAPKGFRSFVMAMPVWLREKLYLKTTLKQELAALGGTKKNLLPKLLFTEHHQSHAASAFFPSPFERAAVLCLDGVGEWATTTVWRGENNKLTPLWEINFPHSLGLLYSAFTYYTGFKVNSGEYKLMGLAPYGEPKYTRLILDKLIDLKPDGTFRLNMEYFNYATGLTMTNEKFNRLFGAKPRTPETPISQREMDIARSIQEVTEEVMLRLGQTVYRETGERYLCMAGGVALNCVANGRLLREGPFRKIWIQPASGDAGGALGAALSGWFEYLGNDRKLDSVSKPDRIYPEALAEGSRLDNHRYITDNLPKDSMKGSFLGPRQSDSEIQETFDKLGARYQRFDEQTLLDEVSEILKAGKVVGWCQGRMEFGPRALGGRSIIGDARNEAMQSVMNLKIKHRESFRPFAPTVLEEDVNQYFDLNDESPYMLLVAPVKKELRIEMSDKEKTLFGIEKLKVPRSMVPAITHVDYSARVQTVNEHTNPRFYRLLKHFKSKTNCSVLVNTSFNVRGEPIVCTALDAYRCFMRTEMDYLVVENFLLAKPEQPLWQDKQDWRSEYVLD